MNFFKKQNIKDQRGMSLIEMVVSMGIGLMTIVVALKVYSDQLDFDRQGDAYLSMENDFMILSKTIESTFKKRVPTDDGEQISFFLLKDMGDRAAQQTSIQAGVSKILSIVTQTPGSPTYTQTRFTYWCRPMTALEKTSNISLLTADGTPYSAFPPIAQLPALESANCAPAADQFALCPMETLPQIVIETFDGLDKDQVKQVRAPWPFDPSVTTQTMVQKFPADSQIADVRRAGPIAASFCIDTKNTLTELHFEVMMAILGPDKRKVKVFKKYFALPVTASFDQGITWLSH